MKPLIILFILSFLLPFVSFGQPTNASCGNAQNICATNGANFALWSGASPNPVVPNSGSIANPSSNPQGVNSGCLFSTELNPNWFVITAGSTGQLVWTIGQSGSNGFYDWALWPYTPGPNACGGISGNITAPVSCNWNASSSGFTGMYPGTPPGGNSGNFQPPLNVTAGQSFILMFSNFSSGNGNVNLSFPPTPGAASVACTSNTPDQTICLGSSATVNIIAPGITNPNFNWLVTNNVSNTASGVNVQVNPTVTTQYIVNITNPAGANLLDTFLITVVNPPTPNAGPDAVICQGTPIPLNGTLSAAGNTSAWTHNTAGIVPTPTVSYAPNAANIDPNVTVNQPGIYTFTLTETNPNCPPATDQVVITVSSTNHTTSFTSPSCAGMADGTITITNPNATEYSYDGGLTWVTNATQGGFGVGTYPVKSRNQYGCVKTTSVTITQPAPLILTAGNDTLVCENGTANLWATTSAPNLVMIYHWDHNQGTAAFSTILPLVNTTVSVYAEGPNGCLSNTETIQVNVRPSLASNISPFDTICPGYPTTIGVSALSGGIGAPYNIVWSTNETGTGSSMDISVNPPTTTTYIATITDGCESTPLVLSTEVYVAPVPVPTMAVVDAGICEPATFELSNTTDPAMVGSYVWFISDGQGYANTSPLLTDEMSHGMYDVQLIVTSPLGCIDSITNYDYITSFQIPVAQFSWSPNPMKMFNTEANFSNQSFLGYTYQWTFEDGLPATSTQTRPTVQFPDGVTGEYEITLIATSENGCIDTVTKILTVLPEVLLYAPNSFTPNGDEHNQTWRVFMEGVDTYNFTLEIYNRWGEMVWESHDIEVGWDGTYNGEKLRPGTYTWKVKARDAVVDQIYDFSGHLNVIR